MLVFCIINNNIEFHTRLFSHVTILSLFVIQVPSLCEDLLSSVDQPLKISRDKETGKDYLLCDYNRDGDSYRLNKNLIILLCSY